MKTYRDCWVASAKALFSQALCGEPELIETSSAELSEGLAFETSLSGDLLGAFTVVLDGRILESPLLGEGVDQQDGWKEILREVAESAAGQLLADTGVKCRADAIRKIEFRQGGRGNFRLTSGENSWSILVQDESRRVPGEREKDEVQEKEDAEPAQAQASLSAGVELLLDVEIEAALRFGCCEMSLGEILELGPGAIVELDRHISDPVDLVVGDKIVARGDVVLVNGNFGLRVTEIAMPQKRLESIRCLF